MKLILVLLIVVLCSLIECHHRHDSHERNPSNELGYLNQSVQLILSAAFQPALQRSKFPKNLTGIQYFWDIMPPIVQVILLQQPNIQTLTNSSSNSSINATNNYSWSSLSTDVQKFLIDERSNLLYLTFEQWGWVQPNKTFANSTLASLFSSKTKAVLSSLSDILAPLKFELLINLDKLEQQLNSSVKKPKPNAVRKFFESFFEFFEGLFEQIRNRKFTGSYSFWQAVHQAKNLIRYNYFIQKY